MDVRLIFILVISHLGFSQETVNNNNDLPRKSCTRYCSGSYKTGAKCINGFCECNKVGYNKYTCLPDVGNCRIIPGNPSAIAIAKYNGVTQKLRSCVNNIEQGKYDVHVLGNYEGNVHTRPASAGTTNVYIKGESSKPVVLVLSSYEPVKWIIHCDSRVKMHAVLMFSYYHTISSVDVSHVDNSASVIIEKARRSSATGDDSGGGDTVGLLKYLDSRWGSVKSFSGCYRADEWTLKVSKVEEKPKGDIAVKSSAVTNCLNSKDCWVQHDFQFEDNWNDCHGKQYVRKTTYKVGKYVGVVLCSSTRYKLFLSDSLSERFLNIGDGSGHGQDHCEFIGSKNDATSIDSNFWDSPGTTGYIRSRRGETPAKGRIGGGTGSSWTGNYYGKWIECGVRIPGNSRVVLSSGSETTSENVSWDKVKYEKKVFLKDEIFTVPSGVTKIDVICVGGGGGGKDGHSSSGSGAYGGDGGMSQFGEYLKAEGGKGAKTDNSGGEGGHGTVANGGQGGIGGGCSAGAGAAGQTSGGGGGKVPGSSTYPYCGGGGSSGGSSCGKEFASIPPGKSGPGGVDPAGRSGGLYGGGGGSRAGGRAGGGGGYSRKVINVSPGQKIAIKVGKAGSPSYWAGKAAQGIVVVSWGGPIDNFVNTSAISTVTNCLNSKDCWVQHDFEFEDNWNDCHGKQYVRKTTYKVGKYVGVVLCSSTRYKLFLSDSLSDRFLNIGDGSGHGQDHCEFIGSKNDATSIDSNFWNSPGTTGYIRSRRGQTPVKGRIGGGTGSSWTGKYYGKWIECGVRIPGNSRVVLSSGTKELTTTTTTATPTTRCMGTYCSGSYTMGAKCVNGYCVCTKSGYNYYTCLPDYAGCLVQRNKETRAVPSYHGRKRSSVYGCINKNSLNLSPEVHVLGCYENINRRPPKAGNTTVDIVGQTTKPIVLVLTSYEPVAWRINVPAGITIQKIMLYSYYLDKSSVSVSGGSNPPVEKSSKSVYGYGSDSGGGHTLKLLAEVKKLFGHVTSFSGTYKVDHWSLTVGI